MPTRAQAGDDSCTITELTTGYPPLQRLANLMHRLRAELPQPSATSPALTTGSIDSLVVIDRQVDLVTPFCTQLTYEGLIDEVIGIKNCQHLPARIPHPRSGLTLDSFCPPSARRRRPLAPQRHPDRLHFLPRARRLWRALGAQEEEAPPRLVRRALCRAARQELLRRRLRPQPHRPQAERRLRAAAPGQDAGRAEAVCRAAGRAAGRASGAAFA